MDKSEDRFSSQVSRRSKPLVEELHSPLGPGDQQKVPSAVVPLGNISEFVVIHRVKGFDGAFVLTTVPIASHPISSSSH